MTSEKFVRALLKSADITLNGPNMWDMQVKDKRMFDRILKNGSLGLGESYMKGWWESYDLEETIYRI